MPIKKILTITAIFAALVFAAEETQNETETTETKNTPAVRRARGLSLAPGAQPQRESETPAQSEEEQAHAANRRVRGLSLADRPDDSDSAEVLRRGTGTSGNVRYGMVLMPIERDTATIVGPKVEKRLISPDDTATLEMLIAILSPDESEDEEETSFERLFERTNRVLEEANRDEVAMSRTPRMLGWIGGNFYDSVVTRQTRPNINVGFGLLFPIVRWFGIKGEMSYMNMQFADSVVGYRGETYCVLKEEATFTIPLLANFMIRPGNLLFDMFAGPSFLGNQKNVFAMTGAALGRKVGKNGYLFADSRFGWSTGERFWSAGIGYEYVIPYTRDPDNPRRRHSIVPKPDTFTVVSRVNDISGGRIAPSGEFRLRSGSAMEFDIASYYGFTLDSLIVNDTIITGEIGRYSILNLRNNKNILAMFSAVPEALPDSFDIIIDVVDRDGELTHSSGRMRLQEGESQEFAIIPEVGFVLDSVVVNGVSVGAPTTYKVRKISSNVNIVAYFSRVRVIEIRQIPTIEYGINFASGTADLTDDSKGTLDAILAVLQQEPDMRIEIAGHTDASGSREFNIRLSYDRAQAVVDYMVERNISADRLVAVGHGPDRPVADNRTREGRAKNRRTEIRTLNTENLEVEGENNNEKE